MGIEKYFDLKEKVALITGGAGLLGTQYAEALAEVGAKIVLVDMNMKGCAENAKQLEKRYPVQILSIQTDVSKKRSVKEMVRKIVKRFGRIDILINNAAFTAKHGSKKHEGYFAPVEEYPVDLWEEVLSINLTGMFLCSQEVGKQMLKQKGGVIINVSSIYGLVGPDQRIYHGVKNPYNPFQKMNTPIVYSVTKGAVLSLTRYLATYWAQKNIRVNCLTLGGVFEGHDKKFVKNYSLRTPLGRMAKKDEYKGAVLFLASDASSYMTGANLVVDGGWTAW
ncbi:SDR family oxidoreductase [candidate division TA06 bacterium]|nr:SDR family oxidoreductase [candidate division TA06 bacterium]